MTNSGVIKTFVLGFLAVCLLTLLGLFQVWKEHRRVQLGANLAEESRELGRLKVENELLEAEYQTLRSARRTETRGFEGLGMKLPSTRDTIVVGSAGRKE